MGEPEGRPYLRHVLSRGRVGIRQTNPSDKDSDNTKMGDEE